MSTTLPPTGRTFRRRWTEFWFAPGDPTTLGFIRIVTGLLILYTHLAYTLDLQAFFGRYGWYGKEYIDRERHEFPWTAPPFRKWDESGDAQPRTPDFPNRRQAVMAFIRGLPAGKAERNRAIQYLDKVARDDTPANPIAGLTLTTVMYAYEAAPQKREQLFTALGEGRQLYRVWQEGGWVFLDTAHGESASVFPEFMLRLPEPRRKEAADDLRALLPVLPKNPTDTQYVLTHLGEGLDTFQRRAFVSFLQTLPEDPAERAELTDYLEYWSNDPRKTFRLGHPIFSVWFHVTDPTEMALAHALALTVMVLFTVGFCTRVTAVLTWIAVVGYIHRTNQILFGMDTMMNILLIYLTIGNSGAALSVDRLIARYRAVRASLRRSGTIDEPTRAFLAQAPPSVGANLGVRLIQVHFCFIYMAAGLSKLKGPAWWDGRAFWDVMINPEFTLMRYVWFEDVIRAIASVKPLYYAITALGVWFTWGLEIAFPFLIWTRLRPFMLWLAVLLHAGIGVLMGLNIFELLMMTMLLVFFPPGVIRDRLRGGPDLPKLGFGFDANDPKQARAAAVVAAADIDGRVTETPARGRQQAIVTAPGKMLQGAEAVSALFADLRLLRVFRFVLFIPGIAGLLARLIVPGPAGGGGPGAPRPGPPAPAAAS